MRSWCHAATSCRKTSIPGRKLGAAGLAAGALVLVAAPAFAAGSPYSGPPILPAGGVPGGFRGVITAITVPKSGRMIHGTVDHAFIRLIIPAGAAPFGEQVVVTKAVLSSITTREYRRLPKNVMHDKAIYALGVLFQKNQRAIGDNKFATIEVSGKQFSRFDYVVVYSSFAHGFVPAPKGHARVTNGHVVVRFQVGTEFAVLGR